MCYNTLTAKLKHSRDCKSCPALRFCRGLKIPVKARFCRTGILLRKERTYMLQWIKRYRFAFCLKLGRWIIVVWREPKR